MVSRHKACHLTQYSWSSPQYFNKCFWIQVCQYCFAVSSSSEGFWVYTFTTINTLGIKGQWGWPSRLEVIISSHWLNITQQQQPARHAKACHLRESKFCSKCNSYHTVQLNTFGAEQTFLDIESSQPPLRLLQSVFILQWFWLRWKLTFFMKATLNPKTFKWKMGFFLPLRLCCALSDLRTTFLNTTMPGPLPVFHRSVSHTKPDIHTPTVTAECDPVILQGWEEFLFASLPQLLYCASFWEGVGGYGGWTRGQKGAGSQGDSRVGRQLSGLFIQPLHNVVARVEWPIENTLWWWWWWCYNKKLQLPPLHTHKYI